MPHVFLHPTSILLLVLSVVVSTAALWLARAHLVRVAKVSSGQTVSLTRKLARLPSTDRMLALRRQASPESIEWRIADEALQVDEPLRDDVVDSVLADVALELEARATWPRAAARIAGASGVLFMALALSLHLEAFVAVILLLVGIFAAIVCMMMERRASGISKEVRRSIDELIDVLELRGPTAKRGRRAVVRRSEHQSRRRRAAP